MNSNNWGKKKPQNKNEVKTQTYTAKQVGQFIGRSRYTVYKMRDKGKLPPQANLPGNLWRIEDIELWFDLNCPSKKDFLRYQRDKKRFKRSRKRKHGDRKAG